MSFGKLYGFEGNVRTTILLVLARAAKLDVELVVTQPRGTDPAYLRLNPQAKIPTFVSSDGSIVLREVIAIAVYFLTASLSDDNKRPPSEVETLLGSTPLEFAQILQWVSYANQEISPPIASWYRPLVGKPASDGPSSSASKSAALAAISTLESHLSLPREYLVSDQLTLADLFTASLIMRGFEFVLDADWRRQNPNVTRWYNSIVDLPMWRAVVPEPLFCHVSVEKTYSAKREDQSATSRTGAQSLKKLGSRL